MELTTTLFKKNIKNETHDTIYTFKIYFATVFSIFCFSKNKLYLNGPLGCNHLPLMLVFCNINKFWQEIRTQFIITIK